MKLADIKPNLDNPRKISDERLALLKESLDTFGDLSGIVHNEVTDRLVGGNQRSKVLPADAEVHITATYEVPTKTGTIAEGYVLWQSERFTYRRVRWDLDTEKLANLAANHHGGEDDIPKLSNWLLDLDTANMRLDLTGIPLADIENLLAPLRPDLDLGDENAVPDNLPEAIVKPGELWILGDHRLLCGDSTSSEDVARLFGEHKASVWASDPPYGINHVEVANEKGQAKGYADIANDDLQDEALREFIFKTISVSLPHMKPNFAFYMWHAMKMQAYFSQAAAAAAGILFHRQIIWAKPQFVFGRGQYHWKHELCLMGWLQGNEPPFYGEKNQSTVWEIGRENDKIHPTQKPVAIWEPSILNHSLRGEFVYEPFAGSGSNLIACEKLTRRCLAMELEPRYCTVIIQRWQEFSGKKAVREDGVTFESLKQL